MAKTVHRLDEEEKKIIDLIRQHKLDYEDIHILFLNGAKHSIETFNDLGFTEDEASKLRILKPVIDKYTKLLKHLEGE